MRIYFFFFLNAHTIIKTDWKEVKLYIQLGKEETAVQKQFHPVAACH